MLHPTMADATARNKPRGPRRRPRAAARGGLALLRWSRRLPDVLLLATLLAAGAALLVPARGLAARSDLILAALVLFTAMGIAPARLAAVRSRWRAVLLLSVGPLIVLTPLAWGIGRAFDGPVRDGTLALGLASTEVAAVGLVALAGGEAALAAAALAGSLVTSCRDRRGGGGAERCPRRRPTARRPASRGRATPPRNRGPVCAPLAAQPAP